MISDQFSPFHRSSNQLLHAQHFFAIKPLGQSRSSLDRLFSPPSKTIMCANDFYECQKANTSYTVILPLNYAPLNLPTISRGYPAWLDSEAPTTASSSSNTVPVTIPIKVPRAFPETGSFGSFGSYGQAGLAC
ncbi:hypothetical protein TELCIR_00416 [Teladorsagia circumcincta]|uniref:Uncharacterized protein n=1 Tax=Teladorsagia circumcincta TaxID=45464 RepID=A0A2G9V4U0_TELCI|nr:hypothetical protein TELCIR_00416 [Teladorsagia circumcincta]